MGNLLVPSPSNYLLGEVISNLEYLTRWTPSEILKIQKKIAGLEIVHNTYLPHDKIKDLFKKSPIEDRYSLIIHYFNYRPTNSINIMEVLAALIVYASAPWDVKVKLALDVFDFDTNHVITYDEMIFMCRCFINAIGIMTQASQYNKTALDALGDQAFLMADSTPDGQITFEEYFSYRFLDWVKNSPVLFELFKKNEPVPENTIRPRKKRMSLIEGFGFEIQKGRPNIFKADKIVAVKNKIEPKKTEYKQPYDNDKNMKILADIFKRYGNIKGKIVARNFYDAIIKENSFASETQDILKNFNFRLYSEVSFDEVKNLIFKRKDMKKNTEQPTSHFPLIHKEETSTRKSVNISFYKSLFDKYDIDHDGSISLKELKIGLREKFSYETIEEIFYEHDIDGNGVLDFQEFINIFEPYYKLQT